MKKNKGQVLRPLELDSGKLTPLKQLSENKQQSTTPRIQIFKKNTEIKTIPKQTPKAIKQKQGNRKSIPRNKQKRLNSQQSSCSPKRISGQKSSQNVLKLTAPQKQIIPLIEHFQEKQDLPESPIQIQKRGSTANQQKSRATVDKQQVIKRKSEGILIQEHLQKQISEREKISIHLPDPTIFHGNSSQRINRSVKSPMNFSNTSALKHHNRHLPPPSMPSSTRQSLNKDIEKFSPASQRFLMPLQQQGRDVVNSPGNASTIQNSQSQAAFSPIKNIIRPKFVHVVQSTIQDSDVKELMDGKIIKEKKVLNRQMRSKKASFNEKARMSTDQKLTKFMSKIINETHQESCCSGPDQKTFTTQQYLRRSTNKSTTLKAPLQSKTLQQKEVKLDIDRVKTAKTPINQKRLSLKPNAMNRSRQSVEIEQPNRAIDRNLSKPSKLFGKIEGSRRGVSLMDYSTQFESGKYSVEPSTLQKRSSTVSKALQQIVMAPNSLENLKQVTQTKASYRGKVRNNKNQINQVQTGVNSARKQPTTTTQVTNKLTDTSRQINNNIQDQNQNKKNIEVQGENSFIRQRFPSALSGEQVLKTRESLQTFHDTQETTPTQAPQSKREEQNRVASAAHIGCSLINLQTLQEETNQSLAAQLNVKYKTPAQIQSQKKITILEELCQQTNEKDAKNVTKFGTQPQTTQNTLESKKEENLMDHLAQKRHFLKVDPVLTQNQGVFIRKVKKKQQEKDQDPDPDTIRLSTNFNQNTKHHLLSSPNSKSVYTEFGVGQSIQISPGTKMIESPKQQPKNFTDSVESQKKTTSLTARAEKQISMQADSMKIQEINSDFKHEDQDHLHSVLQQKSIQDLAMQTESSTGQSNHELTSIEQLLASEYLQMTQNENQNLQNVPTQIYIPLKDGKSVQIEEQFLDYGSQTKSSLAKIRDKNRNFNGILVSRKLQSVNKDMQSKQKVVTYEIKKLNREQSGTQQYKSPSIRTLDTNEILKKQKQKNQKRKVGKSDIQLTDEDFKHETNELLQRNNQSKKQTKVVDDQQQIMRVQSVQQSPRNPQNILLSKYAKLSANQRHETNSHSCLDDRQKSAKQMIDLDNVRDSTDKKKGQDRDRDQIWRGACFDSLQSQRRKSRQIMNEINARSGHLSQPNKSDNVRAKSQRNLDLHLKQSQRGSQEPILMNSDFPIKKELYQQIADSNEHRDIFEGEFNKKMFVINEINLKARQKRVLRSGQGKLVAAIGQERFQHETKQQHKHTFFVPKEEKETKLGTFAKKQRFGRTETEKVLPYRQKLSEVLQSDFDEDQQKGYTFGMDRQEFLFQKKLRELKEAQQSVLAESLNKKKFLDLRPDQKNPQRRILFTNHQVSDMEEYNKEVYAHWRHNLNRVDIDATIFALRDVKPTQVNREVIEEIKAFQRRNKQSLKKMFGSGIVVQNPKSAENSGGVYGIGTFEVPPEQANWQDLMLPEGNKHDFLDSEYLKQQRQIELMKANNKESAAGKKLLQQHHQSQKQIQGGKNGKNCHVYEKLVQDLPNYNQSQTSIQQRLMQENLSSIAETQNEGQQSQAQRHQVLSRHQSSQNQSIKMFRRMSSLSRYNTIGQQGKIVDFDPTHDF